MGLLEPINTRITDPQYFLDTPQQGRTLVLCHPHSLIHTFQILMTFFLAFPHSGSHLAEGWETQSSVANGEWKMGASPGSVFQSGENCGGHLRV